MLTIPSAAAVRCGAEGLRPAPVGGPAADDPRPWRHRAHQRAADGAGGRARLMFDIMTDAQRKAYEENLEFDFSFAIADICASASTRSTRTAAPARCSARFRRRSCRSRSSTRRRSSPTSPSRAGLVLVTGPTGSGKSTTLAAMVNHVNENRAGHILTIEDPIEFVHEPKKCLINQREVGPHTLRSTTRCARRCAKTPT